MKKLVMTVIVMSCLSPAFARSYSHVDSAAKTAAPSPLSNEQLLKGTEFEHIQHDENLPAGVGDSFPTWHWYWNEKAQIDTENKHGFWGNDTCGKFLAEVTNSFAIPVWNSVMSSDLARSLLPIVALLSLPVFLIVMGLRDWSKRANQL